MMVFVRTETGLVVLGGGVVFESEVDVNLRALVLLSFFVFCLAWCADMSIA